MTPAPAVARRLLRWLLPSEIRDDVLANMDDLHDHRARSSGRPAARIWYWRQAFWLPLALRIADATPESGRSAAVRRTVAGVARDVRFAVGMLRRQPGFALAAILTLALGIGANVAVFGVVDAVLLRPLPYPAPERIVEIAGPGQGLVRLGPTFQVSPPELTTLPAFESVGLYVSGGVNLGGESPVRVAAAAVTPEFFAALGVEPALGRLFTDEDIAASGRIALVGDRLWRERLGGAADIVGRSIAIDGSPFVVLGVMPPRVSFPDNAMLWLPTNAPSGVKGAVSIARLVARLRADVPSEPLRDLVIGAADLPASRAARVRVEPLRGALVGAVRPIALAIWAAAALVLLVACINGTNLLLVRISRRHRELAVRRALGATRGDLVRQIFIESFVLSAIGALAAIPVAIWTTDAARVLMPAALHGVADISLGPRLLLAIGGLAGVTTVLFGFGPALSTRSGTRAGGRRWHRIRSALLVVEVGAAVVLLAGAVALVGEVRSVMEVDVGASGERALAIELVPPRTTYPTSEARLALHTRLEQELGALPGVEAVGLGDFVPGRIGGLRLAAEVGLEGRGLAADGGHGILMFASPGFFTASGIDVIAGRPFTPAETSGAKPVAIVSESFARRVGVPPAQVVGRRLVWPAGRQEAPETIVGVVRDVRPLGPEAPFETSVYLPFAARSTFAAATHLVVRAAGEPLALVPSIRSVVARIDPDLPLYNVATFDGIKASLLAERRLAMITMSVFAGLAFVLSAVGLYGVISHLVQLRTREIGIRLAIGASRAAVGRDVLRHGAVHAAVGIALGVGAALAISRVVSTRVEAFEAIGWRLLTPLAFGVAIVALLATWLPAWRASRIDPALTLRSE